MAAHVRIERLRRRNHENRRRPRVFRDRSNPLEDLESDEIFKRYRFLPATVMFIMELIPDVSSPTMRNMPLPPLLQLLVCLRYFATGSTHLLIGDSINISRSAAGKCVRTIAHHLSALAHQFVKFPRGEEANQCKNDFSKIAGFPNVLGCIDGSFVKIQRPKANEADYVFYRKGHHALNVQMCCNAKFVITSCNASWPGSVHDSRVFRSSALCQQFEHGEHPGFLLGDSGYPCRHFLLTPFLNPTTEPEIRYNTSLCRTRVLIEQTFGILKRRFQVLHGEMITEPNLAVVNVIACVVLHNIGIIRGDIIAHDDLIPDIVVQHPQVNCDVRGGHDGYVTRRHIVDTYFN